MDLIVTTKSTREDLEDCEVDFVIKKEGSPSDRGTTTFCVDSSLWYKWKL